MARKKSLLQATDGACKICRIPLQWPASPGGLLVGLGAHTAPSRQGNTFSTKSSTQRSRILHNYLPLLFLSGLICTCTFSSPARPPVRKGRPPGSFSLPLCASAKRPSLRAYKQRTSVRFLKGRARKVDEERGRVGEGRQRKKGVMIRPNIVFSVGATTTGFSKLSDEGELQVCH